MAREKLADKAEFESRREQFIGAIKKACGPDTCYPTMSSTWTAENPLWGHCAVVSEIARRLFGGEIVVGLVLLNGVVARHYWNEFGDLTAEQFSGERGG